MSSVDAHPMYTHCICALPYHNPIAANVYQDVHDSTKLFLCAKHSNRGSSYYFITMSMTMIGTLTQPSNLASLACWLIWPANCNYKPPVSFWLCLWPLWLCFASKFWLCFKCRGKMAFALPYLCWSSGSKSPDIVPQFQSSRLKL